MWAGTVAHNGICGAGREEDWASHNIEHELSALYDCAHGAGLAVICPAWMEYVSQHHEATRIAQMAVRVFGCQMDFAHPENTAKEGIDAPAPVLELPGYAHQLCGTGRQGGGHPPLVKNLHLGQRKIGAYLPMTEESCAAIYRLACR